MNQYRHWLRPVLCALILAGVGARSTAALPPVETSALPEGQDSAPASPTEATVPTLASDDQERAKCEAIVKSVVRTENQARLASFCQKIDRLPSCVTTEGRPIQHMESTQANNKKARGKRILVLGLMHGDEPLAGEMALEWAERLKTIEHRNDWRVVPLINPDGVERKSRLNARGVDLNRNFPTKDWSDDAILFWKKAGASDPRRFPGESPASEAETKCVIAHIKEFQPDFIVSVHTPYKILDFDGPKMNFPRYKDLPWRALGNFPGSLGRFMWRDYQVPVLTVELGNRMVDSAQLQDIVGTFAIEASRRAGRKTAVLLDDLASQAEARR